MIEEAFCEFIVYLFIHPIFMRPYEVWVNVLFSVEDLGDSGPSWHGIYPYRNYYSKYSFITDYQD